MRSKHYLLLVCVVSATSATACTHIRPTPFLPHGQVHKAVFSEITADGFVVTDNGDRWRLRGVQMRSPEETYEPELPTVIGEIVTSRRPEVRVCRSASEESAVVYYDQEIYFRDGYGPYYLIKLFGPKTTNRSINELLVIMGAARIEPDELDSSQWSETMYEAMEKSDLALWQDYRHTRLPTYRTATPKLYVYQLGGFQARITSGDIDMRREHQHQFEQFRRSMAARLDQGERSGLIAEGMQSENRFVRRFVSCELPTASETSAEDFEALVHALEHDPDRYVRACAANTLGNTNETDVRSALRRAKKDRASEVRRAASKALRAQRSLIF